MKAKNVSRLGCQIFLSEDLNGMRIRLPRATKNFYVDGHKPQPHWPINAIVITSNIGHAIHSAANFIQFSTHQDYS